MPRASAARPSPTSSRAETGANLRDCQIAICRIFGLTGADTATKIRTPESPKGVSLTTVRHRCSVNADFINQLADWGKSLRSEINTEVKRLNAQELREEMESELGKSWQILQAAIMAGDLDTARWHIEHVIGKASQPHKMTVGGQIDHNMIWQPERYLAQQEKDSRESDDLLRLLPGDVLDAELVD